MQTNTQNITGGNTQFSPVYPEVSEYNQPPEYQPQTQQMGFTYSTPLQSYNPLEGLKEEQQNILRKVKTFAERFTKEGADDTCSPGCLAFMKGFSKASKSPKKYKSTTINQNTYIDNSSGKRDKKDDGNGALILAAIFGIGAAILGVIGLARADKQLQEVEKDTRFVDKMFEKTYKFNNGETNMQKAYYAILRDSRVIQKNLGQGVKEKRIKTICLLASSALMLVGALFSLVILAKVGMVAGGLVGLKYLYDFVKGDGGVAEKNKKIANCIIQLVDKLLSDNTTTANEAASAFQNWDPTAPTWDQLPHFNN